jgi:hypothetical protein
MVRLTQKQKLQLLEEFNVRKKEKRKEFGWNAGYWTMQNSHMNLFKDLEHNEPLELNSYLRMDKAAFDTVLIRVLIVFNKFSPEHLIITKLHF